ncbi:hypothetical protein HanRHA438_Chr15g0722121 [Helianthus annuus]|nr:hypothetical protein HanRHA438_Chr15g0722121 [Helianthus annuus]
MTTSYRIIDTSRAPARCGGGDTWHCGTRFWIIALFVLSDFLNLYSCDLSRNSYTQPLLRMTTLWN